MNNTQHVWIFCCFIGEWFAYSAGGNFTPHVVTIVTGEVTFFPTNLGVLMVIGCLTIEVCRV